MLRDDESKRGPGAWAREEYVVAYRKGVGLARWQERQRESPVPSRWPYGLDKLSEHLDPVAAVDLQPPSGARERLDHLVRRVTRRSRAGASAAMAWDELTAAEMLAGQPAARYFCGVIWATDQVRSGSGDRRRLASTARTLRRMDGLWVLSRPQAEAVREWLGRDCPPVHFVRFGVDTDFYRPSGSPSDVPHVVSVGGDRDRDPDTLFKALDLVRERHPEVRVTVQSRSERPAPPGVTKIDRLPHVEVARLLADASVAVLATRPNLHASGMTVGLEAQACAVPVVACGTPGMDDYFDDGVTAALVPPLDPERMAAAVVELLDEPDRARAMGRAGREKVLASHTTSTMAGDLANILRGAAEEA